MLYTYMGTFITCTMTYERVWVLSELSSLFHTPTGITYCLTVGALEAIERRLLFALARI